MPAPGDQHRETRASINPFEEPPTRLSDYTAKEVATLQARLDRQLGPEFISTRPGAGGGKVHYLAAEKVINLANEVFGFNGWSSAIQNVQVDFVDETPNTGKITLGLSTIVRVTLKDGTYHEDIGYGHIENCKGKAAAFEKAKKEAATDALKRALRNFGNLLGNCLYDKDYLQKVTKIKLAPSKWDADNLHRHPSYAPIQKESIDQAENAKLQQPRRAESGQSMITNGSEFTEDEFGGNFFDEVDFSHPDEIALGPGSHPEVDRTEARVNNLAQQQARQNSRTASDPVRIPPTAASRSVSGGPMAPPTTRPVNGHSGANGNPGFQRAPAPPNRSHTPLPKHAQVDGPSMDLPPDASVGFVRATRDEGAAAKPFNPNAETPSIRRTQGVNPGKSEPIKRSALPGYVPSEAPADAHQPVAAPMPPRTNFVNPAADVNRKIGMPSGMQSPMGNRGAYKPPSAVKRPAPNDVGSRPPLGDRSNEQHVGPNADAKRPKVDAPQSGPGNQQNAPSTS